MSGQGRKIKTISAVDVQKRRQPSKHYVYVIHVTWDNEKNATIYRRYSRFFDFQHELLEKFPIEAGVIDPTQRIIPFLPGKIYLGRSHVRDVALKRLGQIDEYCQALINLPEKISQSNEVWDFFDVEPDDLNPLAAEQEGKKKKNKNKVVDKISAPKLAEEFVVIADYEKVDKWDLNLKAGMVVDVLEKSESGWWFVHAEEQQGWVPSTYLERRDGTKDLSLQRARPGEEEKYICTDDFVAGGDDEISLDTGAVVEVIQKTLDGWWIIRYNGKEGYAPSTYLMKTEKAHMERVAQASGVQVVSTLNDISDLLKEDRRNSSSDVSRKSLPHILKKSRSMERGGSIRPPPRQQTIKNRSSNLKTTLPTSNSSDYVYCTIAEFTDPVGDGISFKCNEKITVLDKADTGWWFIRIGNKEGWAPSSYIEKQDVITLQEDGKDLIQDENYEDIDNMSEDSDSDDEWDYVNEEPPVPPEKRPLPNQPMVSSGLIGDAFRSKFDEGKPDVVEKRLKLGTPVQPNRPHSGGGGKRPDVRPPPPPPVKSSPIGQNKSEDTDAFSKSKAPPPLPDKSKQSGQNKSHDDVATKSSLQGTGGIADPLKARFESSPGKKSPEAKRNSQTSMDNAPKLPPKLPSKPSTASPSVPSQSSSNIQGRRSPRASESGDPSGNLANVLKSKFEARQGFSDTSDQASVSSKAEVFSKPQTAKPLLPPGKQKPESLLPPNNLSPVGRPLTPPKKSKPPPTPPKSPTFKSKEPEETSDLASVLKAKFEKRNSSSQDASLVKPPVTLPKKPTPAKPTLPNKTEGFAKRGSSGSTLSANSGSEDKPEKGLASALKSKFESGGQNSKPQAFPTKPNLPTKASPSRPAFPTNSPSKPILPSRLPNATSSNVRPSLAVKPFVHEKSSKQNHSDSNTKAPKIGTGNFAALKAKLEQTHQTVGNPPKSDHSHSPVGNAKSEVESSKFQQKQHFDSPVSRPNIPGPPKSKSKTYVAISDFSAYNDGEVSLYEGDIVEVVEKSEDWWLVKVGDEEGWAPATYIESKENGVGVVSPEIDSGFTSPSENKTSRFRTCAKFLAENDGEITFSKGAFVDVLEEADDGWWFVRINGNEGWAPASYIEEV